jgi:hypothetical protein
LAPDFTWYYKVKQELSRNAASVHSNRGGGMLSHLGMILAAAEYDPLMVVSGAAATPWVEPVYPGHQAVILPAATVAQITNLKETWEHNMKAFYLAQEVDKALKAMLLDALDAKYLSALEHRITGLANVRVSAILAHIQATYGQMTPDDIMANKVAIAQPWNPDDAIQDLWKVITDCRLCAEAAGHPISKMDAVNSAPANLKNLGVFPDDIKTWRTKPVADWTLVNLYEHFNRANKEWHRLATAGNQGYASKDKVDATPVLAATLAAKDVTPAATPVKVLDCKMGYCWTHGLSFNPDHMSVNCKKKATGHQDDTTLADMKGGNAKISHKCGDKPAAAFKNKQPGQAQPSQPAQPAPTDF